MSTAVEYVMGASEHEVSGLVRSALGCPGAEVCDWRVERVGYEIGSPTTAGLFRVSGSAVCNGQTVPWSLFVKLLQSWRHWPLLHIFPPDLRDRALADDSWGYEADVYGSDLGNALPVGLRLPRLHQARDLGDDRLALWLEDVRTQDGPWDVPRFERAARLLGRLAARLSRGDHLPARPLLVPGQLNRLVYLSRVEVAALPALRDDAVWAHPLIAAGRDDSLRADLFQLADRLPAVLDALDSLPQTPVHGDACPQNLLVPADDPDGFVAIDWSMSGSAAVGYDPGQLLIGLAHAGALAVDGLFEVHEAIVRSYTAGLAEEGLPVAEDVVRFGMDAALVVRSAFTALPLERLVEPPTAELAELVAARLRLTRYLVDLGLALGPGATPTTRSALVLA